MNPRVAGGLLVSCSYDFEMLFDTLLPILTPNRTQCVCFSMNFRKFIWVLNGLVTSL